MGLARWKKLDGAFPCHQPVTCIVHLCKCRGGGTQSVTVTNHFCPVLLSRSLVGPVVCGFVFVPLGRFGLPVSRQPHAGPFWCHIFPVRTALASSDQFGSGALFFQRRVPSVSTNNPRRPTKYFIEGLQGLFSKEEANYFWVTRHAGWKLFERQLRPRCSRSSHLGCACAANDFFNGPRRTMIESW